MPALAQSTGQGNFAQIYRGIHPQLGTLEDFDRLLEEAHRRGIRIVLDWPLNHTTDKHPWFEEARSSRNARYRNWYVWFHAFLPEQPDLNWRNPEVPAAIHDAMPFLAGAWRRRLQKSHLHSHRIAFDRLGGFLGRSRDFQNAPPRIKRNWRPMSCCTTLWQAKSVGRTLPQPLQRVSGP